MAQTSSPLTAVSPAMSGMTQMVPNICPATGQLMMTPEMMKAGGFPQQMMTPESMKTGSMWTKNPMMFHGLLFLIVSVITFFLLYVLKPTIVRKVGPDGKPTEEVDPLRALIGAVIIGIIVAALIYILRSCQN